MNKTKIELPRIYDANLRYFTDGEKVYTVPGYSIKEADVATFELYVGWFAKDKNHCYLEGSVFKKADVQTFEVLNWAFAKDRNNVYTNRGILKDANPNTFEVIGDGYNKYVNISPCGFGKDKNHIFYYAYGGRTMILKDADLATFVAVDNEFGKDKNYVWCNGKKLKNANLESWQLIGDGYSKDDKNVYCGNELVKSADAESFQVFTDKNGFLFGKDKNHIYNK